jgi:hypothetical protein
MLDMAMKARISVLWGEEAGLPHVPEAKTRAHVRIPVNRETKALLRIRPQDSEFRDVIERAGVSIDRPASEASGEETRVAPEDPDWLEHLIDEASSAVTSKNPS